MQGKVAVNHINLHMFDSDGLTTRPPAQARFGLRKLSTESEQHQSVLTAPHPKFPAGKGLM